MGINVEILNSFGVVGVRRDIRKSLGRNRNILYCLKEQLRKRFGFHKFVGNYYLYNISNSFEYIYSNSFWRGKEKSVGY